MTGQQRPQWLRIPTITAEYDLGDSLIRNMIRDGRLPAVRFGSARSAPILVSRSDVEALLRPVAPLPADRKAAIKARLNELDHGDPDEAT